MPLLSPDATRVLSGVGAGRIYIDGVTPPALRDLIAGGWAWMDDSTIYGNGSKDGVTWALWAYSLATGLCWRLEDKSTPPKPYPGATASYGGGGTWLAYLAGPYVPTDSPKFVWSYTAETQYRDRVARGVSPSRTLLFTSRNNDVLTWIEDGEEHSQAASVASVQIGAGDTTLWADSAGRFHCFNGLAPIAPASGGIGARFCGVGQDKWISQWNTGLRALVAYPWQESGELKGYVLSTDEKDFNHDIGTRDIGSVVITTGVNQGETAIRVYELDTVANRVRVNGGPWDSISMVPMSLDAPVPPVDPAKPPSQPIVTFPNYKPTPQASYGRKGYCGPYFATDIRTGNFVTPGNTEMIVNGTVLGGNQQVDRPVFVGLASTGNDPAKMLGFLGGANDDSMGNAALTACMKWDRVSGSNKARMVRYYDATPIPNDFIVRCERDAIVQIQCYPRAGETPEQSMSRFTESVDRVLASGRQAGIARALNTKFGGLAAVLAIQDPLCAMVRPRQGIILDAWFSAGRWYAGVESGAEYSAELKAWMPILGGLFTGLP